MTTAGDSEKTALTRIDLASGTAQTQDTVPTPVERQFIAAIMPAGVDPTAAFLLDAELANEQQRQRALKTVYSQFISAGPNAIEMQV